MERTNWTLRGHLRRFTRLSNGFSRKKANLRAEAYVQLDNIQTVPKDRFAHYLGALDSDTMNRVGRKVVLALEHEQLPPTLHFETPNEEIDFANSPFVVNTELTAWETEGVPRRAGVSSFGFGGTNAHVIVEEAPLARLYRAWSDARTRARWLADVDLTIRTATPYKSMRITWPDKTPVAVGFIDKGPRKSQVAIQHEKLPDKAAATRLKQYWEQRLAGLREVLAPAR